MAGDEVKEGDMSFLYSVSVCLFSVVEQCFKGFTLPELTECTGTLFQLA